MRTKQLCNATLHNYRGNTEQLEMKSQIAAAEIEEQNSESEA